MHLAFFDQWHLGAVLPDQATIVDITNALPWPHDADPVGNGCWVRLCRDFSVLEPRLRDAVATGSQRPLRDVRLRPPALNPSKIIACASNYADHVTEMRQSVMPEHTSGSGAWLLDFDVFLKAPSSLSGPHDAVLIPAHLADTGDAVHHESELTAVVGAGGRDIPASRALSHVLGYLIGIDVTVRGAGDRSRRKSYDTFTPIGPWLTTADEITDPHDVDIRLMVNGELRQSINTSAMTTNIPRIIAYASSIMRLEPGDLIMTGAPPGVGAISPGDVMDVAMTGLGRMRLAVEAAPAPDTSDAVPGMSGGRDAS